MCGFGVWCAVYSVGWCVCVGGGESSMLQCGVWCDAWRVACGMGAAGDLQTFHQTLA